jgi:hypothetical protein
VTHMSGQSILGRPPLKDAQSSAENSRAVDLRIDSTGSGATVTALLPLRAWHMGVSHALEALIAFKRSRRS